MHTLRKSKKEKPVHQEEIKKELTSRARSALKRLKNKQDLLIYQEIFNPPLSLRPFYEI